MGEEGDKMNCKKYNYDFKKHIVTNKIKINTDEVVKSLSSLSSVSNKLVKDLNNFKSSLHSFHDNFIDSL